MLDDICEIIILYDFYGVLLPPKQREILRLYYEDNLSLGEISEEYGLSRQGVHETVKRGERKLKEYEAKLGLINRFKSEEKTIKNINQEIDRLVLMRPDDTELTSKLTEIKDLMLKLCQ